MADQVTVNRFSANDGRRVEERVVERQTEAGHKERVVETHVEKVPYALDERMVEKIVPIVTERRLEKFDHDGNLMDTIVEQVDDESLHLGQPKLKALTRQDIIDTVKTTVKLALSQHNAGIVVQPAEIPEADPFGDEPVFEEKPTFAEKYGKYVDTGLYLVLSGELAFIIYQMFLRGMLGH